MSFAKNMRKPRGGGTDTLQPFSDKNPYLLSTENGIPPHTPARVVTWRWESLGSKGREHFRRSHK